MAVLVAGVLAAACGDSAPPPSTSAPTGSASSSTALAPSASGTAATGGVAIPSLKLPLAANRQGQTIARAPTNDALFVVDEDHKAIRVFSLPLDDHSTPATTFPLSAHPAAVVALADRLLVTLRDEPNADGSASGQLLVLSREGATGLSERARVPLAADAWGLAVDEQEATAVVTSAWTHTVSVVDLTKLEVRATLDVGREPRGVVILPGGETAFVSHLVGSQITRIDALAGSSPTAHAIDLPASPLRAPIGRSLAASLGYSVVSDPTGEKVYFPRHALGALGESAWFGTPAVDVYQPKREKAYAPERQHGLPSAFLESIVQASARAGWFHGSTAVIEAGESAFVQPRAAVFRRSTNTLLIAAEGTSELVELDARFLDPTVAVLQRYSLARRSNVYLPVPLGGGAPSGIALSADESIAYVQCRSTDDIAVVPLSFDDAALKVPPPVLVRYAEPPEEKIQYGRSLFYDAVDQATSGGLGCAGCHPEGRDDGYIWHEFAEDGQAVFLGSAEELPVLRARWFRQLNREAPGESPTAVGFPRQTPSIVGRQAIPGPFGWHGESATITKRIAAGMVLHRWLPPDALPPLETRAEYIVAFMRALLVTPPHPPSDAALVARGKAIFESAATKCATCHRPSTFFTDSGVYSLPQPPPRPDFAAEENAAFKVPTLRDVGGTAPYFHDGRYASLEALLDRNADQMGVTSHLSADDKQALVAYLRSL
ncbi:MAG: c-type cytochrome [Polyangiaceae bacterium]